MRFGLIANLKKIGAAEAIKTFIAWTKKNGHELLICDEVKDSLGEDCSFLPRMAVCEQSELLVSMGGDGTLLATARAVGFSGPPILGINLGSLGFLTPLTPQQLIPALEKIVDGQYEIQERMLLQAKIDNGIGVETPLALNEFVLDNGSVARLLDINLKVNGEEVVTYKADGLIIATATGSTAYNLAVGGPIMHPGLDAMIVAPISSFSLTTRPMIFLPDDILELQVVSENREALLTADGQVMIPCKSYQQVRISRAEHRIKFVTFPEESYYELLKSKLHWGIPPPYSS